MKLAMLSVLLASPTLAVAAPATQFDTPISELSCVATNGVRVELSKPSSVNEAAEVSASFGWVSKKLTAGFEIFNGKTYLALDASGVNFKTPVSIDFNSRDLQVFSGMMYRFTNSPVVMPVALLSCRIKLH